MRKVSEVVISRTGRTIGQTLRGLCHDGVANDLKKAGYHVTDSSGEYVDWDKLAGLLHQAIQETYEGQHEQG